MERSSLAVRLGGILMAALGTAASGTGALAAPDPYAIIDRYVAGIGGWEKLRAIQTRHMAGTLTIEGSGLEGTFEEWARIPDRKRQVVDLKVIRQVSGDNGQVAWRLDANGKLVIEQDPQALKDREVARRSAANENLERGSKVFTVTYTRLDTAGGSWCHVLRTTNSINSTVTYDYYDTTGCRLVRTVAVKPEGETHTDLQDYREVAGVRLPFRVETLDLPIRQRTIIRFASIELNGVIEPALFEPPSEAGRDFRFPSGKDSVDVPFKFTELHIYIPLTIGGRTRPWVLDSGAGSSVIEAEFAKEIGLDTEGKITGQGANRTVEVSFATLPPFELGGLAFDSQKVVVIALNDIFRRTSGFEIGGILGYDFLSRLVTRVDYAHGMLTFFDPDSFRYAGSGVSLEAPLTRSNMLQIPLTVDGRYSGPWNLDLGAVGLDFFHPYAQQHGLLDHPGVRRVGFGAGGADTYTIARFASIEFAGFTLPRPQVGIPRSAGTGVFSAGEITGNAGNDLFRHFVLYLDYQRHRVIVEKGADFDTEFPTDHSGMQVLLGDDGRMVVQTVAEGTPAEKAGIREGDTVTAIDGRDLHAIGGIIAARELFRAPEGTRRTLDLLRDGRPVRAEITLKDLYN